MFSVKDKLGNWRANWKANWEHYRALGNQFRASKTHTWVGKALLLLILVARSLSLSNVFSSPEGYADTGMKDTLDMRYYMVGWATFLTMLLISAPNLATGSIIYFTVVVCYRIVDSASYRLFLFVVKNPWSPADAKRSFGIVFGDLYEIVVAYAILYLFTGQVADQSGRILSSSLTALYYSVVTITTLGYGDFAPRGNLARSIVICELMTGLVFLAVIIPALTSLLLEAQSSSRPSSMDDRSQDRVTGAYRRVPK